MKGADDIKIFNFLHIAINLSKSLFLKKTLIMKTKLLFILSFIFTVSMQSQIIFEEDFNDETTWSSWTNEDRDGDGELWEFADAEFQDIDSFDGGFIWSFSWFYDVFTPDNTLTSPDISLPTNEDLTLSFKVAAFEDDEVFQEHYAVYVIPADESFYGTETPVFEETLDADYYNPPKTVNVDISSYAGQDVKLVFRHYDVTNIFYVSMDDIKIEQTTLGLEDHLSQNIKIYPNPTTDIVSINGLDNILKIKVFDLKGQLVKEVESDVVNLKETQKGTYIVNFYTDSNVYSHKILKK